jgi:hypothetical protein
MAARRLTLLGLAVGINGVCETNKGCGNEALSPATLYSKGRLDGLHLHITTVHDDAAMSMWDKDGVLKPWTEWSGFQRDVMDWVALKAGFTYTLYSASGYGPNCPKRADGSVEDPKKIAGNYGCAERDTYDEAVPDEFRTHMYWAQYYITPGRIGKSRFTSPVISDVGRQACVHTCRPKAPQMTTLLPPRSAQTPRIS